MADHLIVFVTVPSMRVGQEIAGALLDERLCACVSMLPGVTSLYVWEGAVCSDDELLLIVKTTRSHYGELVASVQDIHPYDVPEIIATEISAGSQEYLAWIDSVVRREDP